MGPRREQKALRPLLGEFSLHKPLQEVERGLLTFHSYESSVDILISKLAAAKKESLEDSKEDPSAVPESFLGTDPASGLSDAEARLRRKAWGSNTMRAEKENKILKFLKYFIGPIQFVMEVGPLTAFTTRFQCPLSRMGGAINER